MHVREQDYGCSGSARNYYQDLGCSFLANDEELRQAWRKLALKYHPDRRPLGADAPERFLRAVEAYEVLSDPSKRRIYDTACQYWLSVEEYLGAFGELLLTVSGLGLKTQHGVTGCEADQQCRPLLLLALPGSLLTAV